MAFDPSPAMLQLWSDERLWLSAAAWVLLVMAWLLGGLRGGGFARWVVLAVAVQAAPVAGVLLQLAIDQPPAADVPFALFAPFALFMLQSLNMATLIALMAAARPEASAPLQAAKPSTHASAPSSDEATAAMAERQRIARDLHDGVATRLVMLLAGLPAQSHSNAQIAEGLQECLLELQVTVDGMGAERMSLGEMLGNLRYRFEPAFRRSGIALHWDVCELEAEAEDGDDRVDRELCKIVQEALANVLRHSGAQAVQVRLAPDGGGTRLALEVSDDGRGLPHPAEPGDAPRAGGRGLHNMRSRAEAIGARIAIANRSPHGLRVSLTLPLPPAHTPAGPAGRGAEPVAAASSNRRSIFHPLRKGWSP